MCAYVHVCPCVCVQQVLFHVWVPHIFVDMEPRQLLNFTNLTIYVGSSNLVRDITLHSYVIDKKFG